MADDPVKRAEEALYGSPTGAFDMLAGLAIMVFVPIQFMIRRSHRRARPKGRHRG